MKEWMKTNSEPLSTVKEYMEKTAFNRAEWIRKNSDLSMQEVIKEYPRLFDTPGMVLLICKNLTTCYSFNIPNNMIVMILGGNRLQDIISGCVRESLLAIDANISGQDYLLCRYTNRKVVNVLKYYSKEFEIW